MSTHTLRFFRTSQDPGDPRREDVHIGFERTTNGGRVTGHAASVHPDFAGLIAAAPELLTLVKRGLEQFAGIMQLHPEVPAYASLVVWVAQANETIARATGRG